MWLSYIILCLHDTITSCHITVGQSLILVKTDSFVHNQVKNSGSFHLTFAYYSVRLYVFTSLFIMSTPLLGTALVLYMVM